MSVPDQMIELAQIPITIDGGHMPVHRDYDNLLLGGYRLDLAGIAHLQAALDLGVIAIREYADRQAGSE